MDSQSYDKTIEALTIISRAITSDQYLEDILRLIVLVTAEAMNSKVCSLWLLDDKTQALTIRATQSINRDYLKIRSLKVGEGVVGYVAQNNKPYLCPNVLEDTRFKEKSLARKMGLVSLLSVPMSVREKVIGVINCYTSIPHHFSETEQNLFTTVANQAAVAIFNTELMVQSKVIQEELETRKLVEKAKEVLIRRRNWSGEEAFRWIQKRSMDSRKSMREVAEAVLLSEEL
jgi:two-component system, response regulator PdtaR